MIDDLKKALDALLKMYNDNGVKIPVLDEIIIHKKWFIARSGLDVSLALNMLGMRAHLEEYYKGLNKLIGLNIDEGIRKILKDEYRPIVCAMLNLMSKCYTGKIAFSSEYKLLDEINFDYDTGGMKVGLIGYGVYLDRLYRKCKEMHAFDLRGMNEFVSISIDKNITKIPNDIYFHVGRSADEFVSELAELDAVIMSGSSIVNGTYSKIIPLCKNCKVIGAYGPSAQLHPDILKGFGFNYVMTMNIIEPEGFIEHLVNPLNIKENEFAYMKKYEVYM